MPTGVVKAFYRSKGYGFIRSDNDGKDVFVHRTAFEIAGLKELRKGKKVTFDVAEDHGRLVAKNVRLVEAESTGLNTSFALDAPNELDKADPSYNLVELKRKQITTATLERSLTVAVRKAAPECEAFVGVIIERVVPETTNGVNWTVKGVRYGGADRNRCEMALGILLREKQQKFELVDVDVREQP